MMHIFKSIVVCLILTALVSCKEQKETQLKKKENSNLKKEKK
jgi:lipoprotein NlpI